jgi:hypothetical protein
MDSRPSVDALVGEAQAAGAAIIDGRDAPRRSAKATTAIYEDGLGVAAPS